MTNNRTGGDNIMMNNFDFFINRQIQEEVAKQLAEAKPKEIIKETTVIKKT